MTRRPMFPGISMSDNHFSGRVALSGDNQQQRPKEVGLKFPVNKGSPQADFESLGFVWISNQEMKLPVPWWFVGNSEETDGIIYDSRGRPRVSVSHSSYVDGRQGDCQILRRFYVTQVHFVKSETEILQWYDVVDRALPMEGPIWGSSSYHPRDKERGVKALEAALYWIKENLPNHENPLAYWD